MVIAKDPDVVTELAWWANNIGVTGGAFDSYLGVSCISPPVYSSVKMSVRRVGHGLNLRPRKEARNGLSRSGVVTINEGFTGAAHPD